jgi:acyl dehydratase
MTEAMPTRELKRSPSMLEMFGRAGLAMVPGASRLPFIAGGSKKEIPALTIALNEAAVDRKRLAAYDRVCGFTPGDALPPTYPHMLAFPLHLALMTDGSFPFAAIGLVHIENVITVRRPIASDERLSLRVWATQLEPHPRGRQFTIRTEVSVGDEIVWEESSTNLKRGGGSGAGGGERGGGSGAGGGDRGSGSGAGGGESSRARSEGAGEELPETATWRLPGDLGRRYGAVSGDLNPIHIHPLTARLFGFPTAIAHGMWTKARCLAALESQLPDAYEVRASFRRPILLPATVAFGETGAPSDPDGLRFGVRDAEKGTLHLEGDVRADL